MERQRLLDQLSDILSILAVKIHIENANNQNSVNIHAENLSIKLLNEVYNCNLQNANYIKSGNYPAIDLIDEELKLGIQITSTPSNAKIINTLEKVVKYYELSNIENLKIFIITKKLNDNTYLKKSSEYNEIISGKFKFDSEIDIIDGASVYKLLQKENDLDKIRRTVNLLESEFKRIPTVSKTKYNLYLDFHPSNINIVSEYSKILIQAGFGVFTSDKNLLNELANTNYQSLITLVNAYEIPSHVHYISVLITVDYLRDNKEQLNYFVATNKIVFQYLININIDDFENQQLFQSPFFFNDRKISNIANNTIKRLVATEDGINIQDDVLTVLKNFRPNDIFLKSGENKYDKNERLTENFDLYFQTTDDRKVIECFVYIYAQGEKFNLNQVSQDLKTILKDKKYPLTILVPKAKHLKNPEKRQADIVRKYPESTFYFIDDFAWQKCNSKSARERFNEQFLMIENFVIPYMHSLDIEGNKSEDITQEDICNWLESSNEPICVFLGTGGIGKTTVARKFADLFLNLNKSVGVLFIEAENIISKLQQQSFDGEINLFSFYYAYMTNQGLDDQCLSKEMFNLHFDNGKILIVIDGLDEVIARLSSFNIDYFIQQIHASTQNNGYGKVIFTCRNHFWLENRSTRANIFTIEILPFDELKARKFFEEKKYPITGFVDKCMRITKKLSVRNKDSETYIPFVLDVVSNLVETQLNKSIEIDNLDLDLEYNEEFTHLPFLNEQDPNDYILNQLFEREILKSNQISSKDQFIFFKNLCIYKNGILPQADLHLFFSNLNIQITDLQLKSFLAHPLVSVADSVFKLKYDFLNFYFQALFFSNYFTTNEKVFDMLLLINYEKMTYNFGVTSELANRENFVLNDETLLVISDEIRQISKAEVTQSRRNNAIGGLFSLCLTLNHKSGKNDINHNTQLLKNIFEIEKGHIENLVLNNLYNTNNMLIKFNFGNLNLVNSHIENYSDFWVCNFNESTSFVNSTFKNLPPKVGTSINAKEINFKNCIDLDNSLQKVFTAESDNNKEIETKISEMLRIFLKSTFYAGGNFKIRELDTFMKRQFNQIAYHPIPFNKFIFILKQYILVEVKNNNKHIKNYQIQLDKRTIVLKFCLENNKRPDIKKIIKDIIMEM